MSDSAAPPLLEVHNLTVQFAGVTALSGVSLALEAGEMHCLMGENGAGKSTLSKVLSGVQLDYEGELRLRGLRLRMSFDGRQTVDALSASFSVLGSVSTAPEASFSRWTPLRVVSTERGGPCLTAAAFR